jgi:alanine racemase
MTRPARVIVDLSALRHNLSRVRALAPGTKVMAILKADAYGHGIARATPALAGADAFGVACLEEAQEIMEARIRRPVVLLEGPFAASELPQISNSGFEIVVHHESQLDMLEKTRLARPIRCWLKIDTGMHRLGFEPAAAAAAWKRLRACRSSEGMPRLMTHLARASHPGDELTGEQLRRFETTCRGLEGERSIANSAGVLGWPDSRADWVRPGLMLYGVSPMENSAGVDHGLRPAMRFASRLISVKRVAAGESVGYGAAWRCPEDMAIGVVAAGYGDGFPRHAKTGTPVVVRGRRTTLIGVASMDMLTVDLRPVPGAVVGDEVELWGGALPIEEVARHAGTIPYELLCGVQKRLSFVAHGEDEDAVSM